MKIGIVTLPLHTNYGGILQVYALQTILERMGHEVRVLDKKHSGYKLHPLKAPLCYAKRIIKKYLLREKCIIFIEKKARRERPIICKYTNVFINQYVKRELYTNLNILPKNRFDTLVVGSDQIWRPKYYKQIENAYLAFAKDWNVKRIAYAPSFGTDKWEYTSKQTAACKALLEKFDIVTVREESGIDLCKEYFNITATHVVDPTLLLEKEDYESLVIKAKTEKSKGDLLVYVLDRTTAIDKAIKDLAAKEGMTMFYTGSKIENLKAALEERIQPPVENWIRGFMDAKLVITDSFHACVFSIIFNKPFIALGNKERGMSRFSSLLNLFGLEDRLVTSLEDAKTLSPIDWECVNQKHDELKKQCKNLLTNNL